MCEQDQRTVQHDGRKVTRNFERHLDFTPDLPMLEEHTVARLSQTSPNRHYKSLAIRQIVLCSSARSITAATMPSFLGEELRHSSLIPCSSFARQGTRAIHVA